jgi:hypothetical protein
MEVPITLPLCEYENARGRHRLSAMLDADSPPTTPSFVTPTASRVA